MTTIRKEKRKKRSIKVTISSEPTPQPRHGKLFGANANNTSEIGVDRVSEGVLAISGGNVGGVSGGNEGLAVTGGNEGEVSGRDISGVDVAGGNEGGVVAGGNEGGVVTEVGTSNGPALDKGKSVVEEDKKDEKKKYLPKDSALDIIDIMVILPPKKNERPWGAPRDRSVLIGYQSSWAARVCATKFPNKEVPRLSTNNQSFGRWRVSIQSIHMW
ncbi:uncharacterized protein LOC113285469 [Papaver somniferum]|uniref:uncharacterized protein LOC113285469 n=1 Tax=Papaver somniferum TaxID=3469 RepID=UPI000E6F7C44|nr:uncharacterized protein LOC113285469 [Papaver somniferum]